MTRYLLMFDSYGSCFCGAPSLTKGWVCLLHMLLALASAVFLESESLGTRDHILLSHIWDFPSRRLLRLAGSRWRYSTPLPHELLSRLSESESYVTTDGQSASLSWNKAPIWGLRPDFYYRRTVAGLLMWGALSDGRTGLSFTIAAGPCQRSHSLVRAPLDSRPYSTVSDLRLPISSPIKVKVKVTLRLTVSQSVSLGVEPHLGLMTRYLLLFDSYGLVFCGAPSLTENPVATVARRGRHRKQPHLLLRVRPCLLRCCLTTRWSNLLQYV
jgi:hypothetical protein